MSSVLLIFVLFYFVSIDPLTVFPIKFSIWTVWIQYFNSNSLTRIAWFEWFGSKNLKMQTFCTTNRRLDRKCVKWIGAAPKTESGSTKLFDFDCSAQEMGSTFSLNLVFRFKCLNLIFLFRKIFPPFLFVSLSSLFQNSTNSDFLLKCSTTIFCFVPFILPTVLFNYYWCVLFLFLTLNLSFLLIWLLTISSADRSIALVYFQLNFLKFFF